MTNSLHMLDIGIIATYLVLCLMIGFYKIPKIRNIRDYTIGGKQISLQMLAGTLLATHIGAGSTVGNIEKIYSMGALFALVIVTGPLIWITTCYVFAKRIQTYKEAGCISLSDMMEYSYGVRARWITNIMAKVVGLAVIAMQILAIGYLLSYFLGISEEQGAMVGFGVIVLYSAFGGIRAIMVTDMFQAAILYIGIPAACFAAYADVGGYDGIIEQIPAKYLGFELSQSNLVLFLSLLVWQIMPFSQGAFVQRFLMANNNAQVWKVGKTLFFLNLPIAIVVIVIGYIVRVKAPDINPNIAFYYLIDHYLPIGVKGLVITGILAAIMSTADSWLNTASVVWAHDVIKKLFPKISDLQEVFIARIAVVAIGLLAAILAFLKPDSVMAMDWLACSLWEPIVFVPLMAGLYGYKFSSTSHLTSVIFGVIFALIGAYYSALGTTETLSFDTESLCTGLIGSAMGMFLGKYFGSDKEVIAV